KAGRIAAVDTYDAIGDYNSKPLHQTTNTWQCANPSNGSTIACPLLPAGEGWGRLVETHEKTNSNFSVKSSLPKTKSTIKYTWHQCSSGHIFGNVAHSSTGDASGAPRTHTHTDYACNETAYIVDKPSHVWTNNSGDTSTLEEKWFFYDGHTDTTIDKGNVT